MDEDEEFQQFVEELARATSHGEYGVINVSDEVYNRIPLADDLDPDDDEAAPIALAQWRVYQADELRAMISRFSAIGIAIDMALRFAVAGKGTIPAHVDFRTTAQRLAGESPYYAPVIALFDADA